MPQKKDKQDEPKISNPAIANEPKGTVSKSLSLLIKPVKRVRVIYVDPPWIYGGKSGVAAEHKDNSTMSQTETADLATSQITDE